MGSEGGGGWVALRVGLAITLAGLAVGSATACRDPAQDDLDGLADHIRASMADWDLPGLAVAVVHDDEVVFAEGFGVKELGRDDPVDAHTLFQIGSVSKSFGAAAVGALVDDGLVDWDDAVVEHLPWFRVKDPEFTRRMTIRDLLAHTSGMPGDAFPVLAVMGGREVAERARLLDNFGVPGDG
ncbi:MAG: beta-lactamase family protein, partial [Gemmatimonadetes bacterium]|nr:beta-lactamase family protein [Gemmatimonadota bacterium]